MMNGIACVHLRENLREVMPLFRCWWIAALIDYTMLFSLFDKDSIILLKMRSPS